MINTLHFSTVLGQLLLLKSTPSNDDQGATQRAKIVEKVHKAPIGVNVINLEFNGFNASIKVPWSPSDTKKL